MPQLVPADWVPQLIWLAITFTALYFIMARVALPRIANAIEERRDRIASDLDQAEQLKRETEEAIAAYEQALAEARSKAHDIAQKTRDELTAEIEAERAGIDEQIADKTGEAEKRIQAAKSDALKHIGEIANETAAAIVQELIGGRTTKADVNTAVDAAMKD